MMDEADTAPHFDIPPHTHKMYFLGSGLILDWNRERNSLTKNVKMPVKAKDMLYARQVSYRFTTSWDFADAR